MSIRMPMRTRGFTLSAVCVVLATFAFSAAEAQATLQFKDFTNRSINEDGSPDVQAGSHPWEMITNFDFVRPTEAAKDIEVEFPPGWVGFPGAVAKCSIKDFETKGRGVGSSVSETGCPIDSQVGVAEFKTDPKLGENQPNYNVNLYNLEPPPGVPAELGANAVGEAIIFQGSARTGGDNGLTVSVHNITEVLPLFGAKITTWGVPADPSHDGLRGRCLGALGEEFGNEGGNPTHIPCPSSESPKPFLTQPTSCPALAAVTRIRGDSWEDPGDFSEGVPAANQDSEGNPMGMQGCDELSFRPSLSIAPDTTKADTPAGLTAEVKLPQDGLLAPEGRATATLQNTTVVLPAGIAINPGQAAGLIACQPSQDGVGTEGPPNCPNASTVGTAELETPLLPDKLKGNIYILPPNPPHLQILLALSGDGVNLKLIGDVNLNQETGQLTTTFANTPSLPFTDFKLAFSGGAQAALVTPSTCGTYTTSSDFTPWSAPLTPDAFGQSAFQITAGPGGSAGECRPASVPLAFSPSMIAGATTDQAGGYTGFSLLLQRGDGQQRIERLQFKTPAGLSGMISKVPVCQEPQAALGECPAASQIGHTVVASGPGPFPLIVPEPGKPPAPIYLTGPYDGAPFGLSIVVPVEAGPFNLGTVVVRASIAVDPHTTQLTITTDPLPRVLAGVPTDLRTIDAVIDRPGFMFNPTNCSPQTFTGTAYSTQGASAAISSPFQVGSCKSLAFDPGFKVTTRARTSRAYGASLTVKVASSSGPASGQANFASAKVELPKELPSRLTTLQKACVAATFESDPASCPAASIVGRVRVLTPELPVPLEGPAYFVSHGGEAFPSLIFMLQGDDVTLNVVSTTFISKGGVTSATLKSVPDAPFTSFELTLPQGPYSALTTSGNLCAAAGKLTMPTLLTAQNGLVVKRTTKIAVTGCPPARPTAKRATTTARRAAAASRWQRARRARGSRATNDRGSR